MKSRFVLAALASLGSALWTAPAPAHDFPLAAVDATRLRLEGVRVLEAWPASDGTFPWQVRYQDPRATVVVPSPDGQAAVWRGSDKDGYWLFYRRRGGPVVRLENCHNAYQPVWSPDSRRVAYCAMDWKDYRRGIYQVRPSRGAQAKPRLLFQAQGHLDGTLAYTPDGTKLVFAYWGKLWIMNSNGIGRCLLDLSRASAAPVGNAQRVGFNQDGTLLAWEPLGSPRVLVGTLEAAGAGR